MKRNELLGAKWIRTSLPKTDIAPIYFKEFDLPQKAISAKLLITACGVYVAKLNGNRVGKFVLAPGWTPYEKRMQYQTYDITSMLKDHNEITVTIGKGWHHSRIPAGEEWNSPYTNMLRSRPYGFIARIDIEYENGSIDSIGTDTSWKSGESVVRFSDNYDGETVDATVEEKPTDNVFEFDAPTECLVDQEGELITENERLLSGRILHTPNGEVLIDFGQDIAGYVEAELDANEGDILQLSCGEVLDKHGNLYNENYRSAKALFKYTCKEGKQIAKPDFTYYGFRYIRVDKYPGGLDKVNPRSFTAIVVGTNIKRTGFFECSDININRIYKNIIWTQKSNTMDVSTDCPQRDERQGWLGDAVNFIDTACLNFDVDKFYTKWVHDIMAAQREDGFISVTVPDVYCRDYANCAGGYGIIIFPLMMYKMYGNIQLLRDAYPSMVKWIDYQDNIGAWTFGDWLGLDAEQGSYLGATREQFVVDAFLVGSLRDIIKIGRIIGEDTTRFEDRYKYRLNEFQEKYPEYYTQTECVLAAYFEASRDPQKTADQLAKMIQNNGGSFTTGMQGMAYLFQTLARYGHGDVAYDLIFREQFPSWIYQVRNGGTTIWEHWDSILEDGSFWSSDMNSFNHFALGSNGEWFYTYVAGIQLPEDTVGYEKVRISPHPDKRLDWVNCKLNTRNGEIISNWILQDGVYRYEIGTPVKAQICIEGQEYNCWPGNYVFYGIK